MEEKGKNPMLHTPFRRRLAILLSSTLLIGLMLSVAAGQALARGMQRHVAAQTSVSFNVPNIDSNCNTSSFTPIVSFHAGDAVQGTAVLVSTPSDPAEAGEHEDLFLQGTNVPSIPSIAVDTGSHSFSFTATGDGSLTACVGGSDGGDGDESGTVSGTVTTPVPVPTPTTPTTTPTPTTNKLIDHLRDIIKSLRPKVDVDGLNTFLSAFQNAHDVHGCITDITEGVAHSVPLVIQVPTPQGVITVDVEVPQLPLSTADDCQGALQGIIDVLQHSKVDPKNTPLFFIVL